MTADAPALFEEFRTRPLQQRLAACECNERLRAWSVRAFGSMVGNVAMLPAGFPERLDDVGVSELFGPIEGRLAGVIAGVHVGSGPQQGFTDLFRWVFGGDGKV